MSTRAPEPPHVPEPSNANSLLASGAGVALVGIAGAALGVACPLCVVAAPALIGAGAFKKAREWKRRHDAERTEEPAAPRPE